MSSKIYSKITGTGRYLPPNVFTNEDWGKWVDTTDEWIIDRTGIKTRHIASKDETTAGMGVKAAQQALEMAGLLPKDIQMVIATTGTADTLLPTCACLIQEQLGIPVGAAAFDLQAACSGFIYALSVADQFIKSGHVKNILVISTEMLSRLIDWKDRNTCVLFGDGAGAVVVQASKEPGILMTKICADGAQGNCLTLDNMQLVDHSNLIHNPLSKPLAGANPYIQLEGRAVFKMAVQRLAELVTHFKNEPSLKDEEIDWLVPHQANIRVIQAAAQKIQFPMDKVICTVQTHSNTSSASIPLALDVAVRDGRIQRGQNLVLEAFGAGITWGSCFVKF